MRRRSLLGYGYTLLFSAVFLHAGDTGGVTVASAGGVGSGVIAVAPPAVDLTVDLAVSTGSVTVGQKVSFSSMAKAGGRLAYHGIEARKKGDAAWQNWGIWNDAGGDPQSIGVVPAVAGTFELRAYAAYADRIATYSASTTLVVTDVAPAIDAAPAAVAVTPGQAVNLSVTASGTGLNYQWQLNGAAIAGATGASLNLAAVQYAQGGDYTVTVSNTAGSLTSPTAAVQVVLPVLPAITISAWHFPSPGVKQSIPVTAAQVGDVVTVSSTENLATGAGWHHNLLIRRPAITSATALEPEDGSGLNETTDVWNKDGWTSPFIDRHAYDPTVIGKAAVDLGLREPFMHTLEAAQTTSTRSCEIVLDAPGAWVFGAEVTDASGQPTSLAANVTVMAANAALAGDPANMTYPYGRQDRFVGVFWNAGQAHRLWSSWRADHQSSYEATWAVNWKLMWQPSPYFSSLSGGYFAPNPAAESPWQPFWSAHQVYPLVPDGAGGSVLTHDMTSLAFAEKAALRMMDIGVDFVTVDYTNQFLEQSEAVLPAVAHLAQAFRTVAAQSQSGQAIKLCALLPGNTGDGDWDRNGGFTPPAIALFNRKLTILYNLFARNPAAWFYLEDDNHVSKPLLMLWIGAGGGEDADAKTPDAKLAQLRLADGRALTDVFTIRWVGAFTATSSRFTTGGTYMVKGAEGDVTGNLVKPKFWSYRETYPSPATVAADGSSGIEAITVQPDAAGHDRFGRAWQENWPAGEGMHYETPLTKDKVPLDAYGKIWGQALATARALDPKFMLTIWAEFGSENDEPRPEMAAAIMDNNKYGTHFGDAFRQAVRLFKYRAPQAWIDTYSGGPGASAQWFNATPVAGWAPFHIDQTLHLQGSVTPNVSTAFTGGSVKVYLDGAFAGNAVVGGAWQGATSWIFDLPLRTLQVGAHTLKVVADDGVGGTFQAGYQFQSDAPRNVLTFTLAP